MKLPIVKKLKKREYSEIATFQDSIIDLLYSTNSNIVLHGGTVIWRCFGGNRFSNDIDAYLTTGINFENMKDKLKKAAIDYGIKIEKAKDTGNLLFIGLSLGNTYLKVEINHVIKNLRPVAIRFERVDGTFRDVLSLSAEDLIIEKIDAYTDRRFIRDIYDIYILSNYADKKSNIKKRVSNFLKDLSPPVNEEDLASLIYDGPIPSFKSMLVHIKRKIL